MAEPQYTWAQIEQAACEMRLEIWTESANAGDTAKDAQLSTRANVLTNIQRKLHQLFPEK